MTAPTLLDHVLIGMLAAFGLFAALRGQAAIRTTEFDTATKLSMYWSNAVLLWIGAVAVGVVWVLAGRPLADLGLTWAHARPGAGAAIGAALVAIFAAHTWSEMATGDRRDQAFARFRKEAPFLPVTAREFAHFTVLALTASITEEIIFRGFVISYLGWYTGSTPLGVALAVALPAVAFGLVHRYQRPSSRVKIFVMGIGLGAIFVLTGSLVIPIVLHALVNVMTATLVMRVGAAAGPDGTCTS